MSTILIIDDYPINREFLMTLLSYQKYHLLEANDGIEALEILRREPVDLVITDILMPNMDGYNLAQTMRTDFVLSKIPVIFYTATYRIEEAQLLADACGVKVVLSKPTEPAEILWQVNKILGMPLLEQKSEYKNNKNLSEIKENFYGNSNKYFLPFLKDIYKYSKSLVSIEKLQQYNQKMAMFIELGFNLSAEHNVANMLQLFNKAACKIMGAHIAVSGIVQDKQNSFEHLYGYQQEKNQVFTNEILSINSTLLTKITAHRCAVRATEIDSEIKSNLGILHPLPNHAFLGVPIFSATENYGVVYLIGKQGSVAFTDEDEHVALAMSSKLSILYENIKIYNTIQQHAANLHLLITERKKTEQALLQSEMQFRQFAENIPEIFWIATHDLQKIIYVNAAYERIWGKTAESLYQNPSSWLESVLPEDRPAIHHAFHIDQQKSISVEYRILRPDGTIRWIHSRGFVIKDSKGEDYRKAGIASDITDRKQAEELAYRHQAEIAQISRVNSMGEMASALAHELNQPLTALSSYVRGCVHHLEEGTAKQADILKVMKKAAKNAELAGNLIHRMKNFVRRGELLYEQVNINKTIKRAVSLLNYEMHKIPVTINFELSENLPLVTVDKIQIEQVLLNLLRNSIDAMDEIKISKPIITLKTCALNAHNIIVSLCDNGPGIATENIDSLFKPYFSTKSRGKGMGIGLSICLTIIEAHGGQISAHTLSEGGACFEFTLPLKP